MSEIGKNIAAYRTAAGETQTVLGGLLGVSDKTISKWEAGDSEPNLDAVCKIAEHYRVAVDVLLGRPHEDWQTALNEEFSKAGSKNALFDCLCRKTERLLNAAIDAYDGEMAAGDTIIPNALGEGRRRSILQSDFGETFLVNAPELNISVTQFQNASNFQWMTDAAGDIAELFSVFADPCAVKLTRVLARQDFPTTFTAGYAAEKAGVPCEKAAEILDKLVVCGQGAGSYRSMTADLTDGTATLYECTGNSEYLAMLSMAYLIVYGIQYSVTAYSDGGKLIRKED